MRLKGVLLACLVGGQALAQGVIRLEPSGGVLVPIPVFPTLPETLSLQAYLVFHDALTALAPVTSMRPDPFGISRVDPVQITVPNVPDYPNPIFRLRVWDPRYGSSYTEADAFLHGGQSEDIIFSQGTSFTPTLVIVPEPSPWVLMLAGFSGLIVFRSKALAFFHPPANTGRKPALLRMRATSSRLSP